MLKALGRFSIAIRHSQITTSSCSFSIRIFVFFKTDSRCREQIVHQPDDGARAALRPGVRSSLVLFEGAGERVMLEDWQPGANLELPNIEGLELLLLDGTFREGSDRMDRLTWLRLPAGDHLRAHVGAGGARVWYKCALLLHEHVCAFDGIPSLDKGKG